MSLRVNNVQDHSADGETEKERETERETRTEEREGALQLVGGKRNSAN